MTRVLVTGSAGGIGSALCERLPALGWTVRGFDRVPSPGLEDAVVAELADARALFAACTGVDAVVHLAGIPTEVPWPAIREANIDGTYSVFETARRAGVTRLVFASTNHAVGYTPVGSDLSPMTQPRPDTLYGVSKAVGEALGSLYADRYGIRVACLRIGSFSARPENLRALSTWLSPADCARLVDACLRSEALRYQVLWGVSANTRRVWSDEGWDTVGYVPEDDAEAFAADLAGAEPQPGDDRTGGDYTTPAFGIDQIAARYTL
jgi:uronate dehydrogenase